MVGKNNKQEQLRKNATKNTRFSLKKLSVGVASVAVGASLLVGNVAHAEAEENNGMNETEITVDQVLVSVKTRAQDLINKLELSDEAKIGYTDRVEQAVSVQQVEQIVSEAYSSVKPKQTQFSYNLDGKVYVLGNFDNAEQAELALRKYANENGLSLDGLTLEGAVFKNVSKETSQNDQKMVILKGMD